MSATAARTLALALIILVPFLAAQEPATGEQKELTLEMAIRQPFRFFARPPAGLAWHPDGKRLVWVEQERRKASIVASAPEGGDVTTLVDQKDMQLAIKKAGFKLSLPLVMRGSTWNPDGQSLRVFSGGVLYRINLEPLKIERRMAIPGDATAQAFNPDDTQVAYVRKHDITVVKSAGSIVPVTSDGNEDVTYGGSASRSEFGIHDGLWWSPDGRRLAFFKEDLRPIPLYPYQDFGEVPAKPVHGRYPMAGGPGSRVQVGVYDSQNDKVVFLASDPTKDEYLTNVTWNPDGTRVFVAHVNRAQDTTDLVEYDAATGKRLKLHFTEKDKEWIEPEAGPIFRKDGKGAYLWFSFRDGYRHLYLYSADGKLQSQVTDGDFDVTEFKAWDADGGGFFFETTGPDPRQLHLYHVTLGGAQKAVTSGRGRHTTEISSDGQHIIDIHTNLELPLAVDILDAKGKQLRRLKEAKNPLAGYRLPKQELFTLKARDGATLYGHVILPPDMDPQKKYPVIQYVYGGPHVQLVQDQWLGGRSRWICWMHYMASQGYVIVQLDNHGTPWRGIEFQQAIFRKMGTLEIEEQSMALDHVLAKGWGDPARVGVTGWSYGGFMTLSLMTRKGDRYAAGVSGAPVTDWRFYETGYGERYMDTPQENPKGYKQADPANHVKGLKGRLLVVQGTSDDTVMWQNTIHFLNACIDADVPVEYMVYPGQKHGLGGKDFIHFIKKTTRFFKENLAAKPATAGK